MAKRLIGSMIMLYTSLSFSMQQNGNIPIAGSVIRSATFSFFTTLTVTLTKPVSSEQLLPLGYWTGAILNVANGEFRLQDRNYVAQIVGNTIGAMGGWLI